MVIGVVESVTVCRCGTRIPRGGRCLRIVGLPSELEVMFRGEVFCSPRCVQATFLEDLSVLESLTTPEAERQVIGLRDLYVHLSSSFTKLFGEASETP
jgi:hypothetical protein